MSVSAFGMMAVFGLATAMATGQPHQETPFSCNLKALTAAQRTEHQALTARLAEAVLKTRELSDGYAFDLDSHRISIADLATWTDYERRCCPFFDFHLEWRRENGTTTLSLTGREGVKAFIQAEFESNFR